MKIKKITQIKKLNGFILRLIFALVGLFSLFKIVKNYGFHNIALEIIHSGYFVLLLVFTFVPTILCYAISWLLITDHQSMFGKISFAQKIYIYTKFTIVSIAWNNLTPFLKIGGEPLKYEMLLEHLPHKKALSSTIHYNIIHILGTSFSFVMASILLAFFYPMPDYFRFYLLSFAFFFSFLFYLGFLIMRAKFVYVDKTYRFKTMKIVVINVKLIFRRMVNFFKKNPDVFFLSLFFDIVARFIEGMTFYFGFYLIEHPISFINSSLLEIGRTFIDTLFFFVPYQIGTREEGVHFLMEKMLMVDSKGFLTAVFFSRFVEIFWIFIGYMIWMSRRHFKTTFKAIF